MKTSLLAVCFLLLTILACGVPVAPVPSGSVGHFQTASATPLPTAQDVVLPSIYTVTGDVVNLRLSPAGIASGLYLRAGDVVRANCTDGWCAIVGGEYDGLWIFGGCLGLGQCEALP